MIASNHAGECIQRLPYLGFALLACWRRRYTSCVPLTPLLLCGILSQVPAYGVDGLEQTTTASEQRPSGLQLEKEAITKVQSIVGEIRKTLKDFETSGQNTSSIQEQVRLATWELLLGEYTSAYPSLSLWTTSINSLVSGQERLAAIETRIEADPTLEGQISSEPLLAIRLDAARVRRSVFNQTESTSRKHETDRLVQLRAVVNDYRDLNEELVRWLVYQSLEDDAKSLDAAKQSLSSLNKVFKTVRSRRDYHLFDDESSIDGDDEFDVVQVQPIPFSTDPISMIKSVQGLIYYNLAKDSASSDPKLLEKAKQWAHAALTDQDNLPDAPKGADSNNLIAGLVLGLIEDIEGDRLALDADPKKRREAADHFSRSRKHLLVFLEYLKANQYSDSSKVRSYAKEIVDQLTSAESLTKQALAASKTGQPDLARELLLKAIKRHRLQSTALDAIELGLRVGTPIDKLEMEYRGYLDIGIINSESASAQLLLARLLNRRCGNVIVNSIPSEKAKAIRQLPELRKQLLKWSSDAKVSDDMRARIQANYALASVYFVLLANTDDDAAAYDTEIEEAYRQAKNAEFYLAEKLGEQDSTDETAHNVGLREALVASRIAAGHLAAMYLDDWRDESRTFFAAAADEAAKLDMATPVLALIGSPLIEQMFKHSEGGHVRLANEERQRRQMVTRCLEAMFTLHFGEAVEGADQMAAAIKAGTAVGGEEKLQVDAGKLSIGADGFDAKVTLPDTIRAFGVLSEIKAQRYAKAVAQAVSLASNQQVTVNNVKTITKQQWETSFLHIQSPLVAFSFAKAIESYVVNLSLTESVDYRLRLLDISRRSYERGAEMLEASRLSTRYPHIHALISQSASALRSPDLFLEQASTFQKTGQLSKSLDSARAGLSRHPKHQPLWSIYLAVKIERIKRAAEVDQHQLSDVLKEINTVHKLGLVSDYEKAFNSATVHVLANQPAEAEEKFREAHISANSSKERILAISEAARLMAIAAAAAQ